MQISSFYSNVLNTQTIPVSGGEKLNAKHVNDTCCRSILILSYLNFGFVQWAHNIDSVYKSH